MDEKRVKGMLSDMNYSMKIYLDDKDNRNNLCRAIVYYNISVVVQRLSDYVPLDFYNVIQNFNMFSPLQDYVHLYEYIQDYCCE